MSYAPLNTAALRRPPESALCTSLRDVVLWLSEGVRGLGHAVVDLVRVA